MVEQTRFSESASKTGSGAEREEFSTQYHLGPIRAEGEKKRPLVILLIENSAIVVGGSAKTKYEPVEPQIYSFLFI